MKDEVTIGTGACIFGPLEIQSNMTIPANAVVTPNNRNVIIEPTD